MSTSALPTLRQLPHAVGTAGPQLQVSERTGSAGPQPGTCRVQWAPLDLNLGPSELSEQRRTSTWDPVSTAGPQPGTFRAHWTSTAR